MPIIPIGQRCTTPDCDRLAKEPVITFTLLEYMCPQCFHAYKLGVRQEYQANNMREYHEAGIDPMTAI